MNDNNLSKIGLGCWVFSALLTLASILFFVWVVLKLMQYFGVI